MREDFFICHGQNEIDFSFSLIGFVVPGQHWAFYRMTNINDFVLHVGNYLYIEQEKRKKNQKRNYSLNLRHW